tara:strand:- start:409 stop:843 length:435 start_codon:yes stop_codon:yes gene_type:complete
MQNGTVIDITKIVQGNYILDNKFSPSTSSLKLIHGTDKDVDEALNEILANIPKSFSLGNNYPNPFNSNTVIPFSISEPGKTSLFVYDINGRIVKKILNEYLRVGYHTFTWDGKNGMGHSVSSGIYYYELKNAFFTNTKKMILIK